MRVCITGAGGYIGGRLANAFALAGIETVGLVRKMPDRVPASWTCRTVDLSLPLPDLGAFDAVIHCASRNRLPPASTSTYIRDNIIALESLLEFVRQGTVGKFIFFSSISVYEGTETAVVRETTPMTVSSDFALSKILCERRLAEEADRLPVLVLRPPGVIGQGAHDIWLARIRDGLRRGNPVTFTNGSAPFNNVVLLDDLAVFARRLVTDVQWNGFDAINLAARESMTIREIVSRMAESTRSLSTLTELPPGNPPFSIDVDRAVNHYGFSPTPLDAMLHQFATAP